MTKQKLIFFSLVSCFIVFSCYFFTDNKAKPVDKPVIAFPEQDEAESQVFHLEKEKNLKNLSENPEISYELFLDKNQNIVTSKKIVAKEELTRDNNQVPFSAIVTMTDLPEKVKAEVDDIAEQSNVLYLKYENNNAFMVIDSSSKEEYPRLGIELVNIDNEGNNTYTVFGYEGQNNIEDNINEDWEFDKVRMLPKKHISYLSDGSVEYFETWNYSSKNPIKYVMKDKLGNVIALKKEYQDSDSNIRMEHLVYDNLGNVLISISVTYEGPDIARFTYYNAENNQDGITIISEFKDGLKSKEEVYSGDYKLQNIYKAEYEDGERANIKILDKSGVELEEILAE